MPDSARRPLVSILGDSISTFEGCNPDGFDVFYEGERRRMTGVERVCDTWWRLVVDAIGGDILVNGSFSGSMVEGAGFPAASSVRRVAALSRDGMDPDIVIAFIGINDYGWGGPANQAAGRGRAVPDAAPACEERTARFAAEDAAAAFGTAYGVMLGRVRAAYPDAQVWCCTLCPGRLADARETTFIRRLRGVDVRAYDDAIRLQASDHGCRVIDLASFGLDYEAVDGTHPTARGMRQLASMAVRSMARQGMPVNAACASELDAAFEGDDMHTKDACDRDDCLDCPFARATGNTWSLVCEKDL